MKLAAVEGLYEGGTNVGLVGIGVLNPEKKTYNDGKDPFLFRFEIPSMLSFLAERNVDGYVMVLQISSRVVINRKTDRQLFLLPRR